jgi:hypothetical protein
MVKNESPHFKNLAGPKDCEAIQIRLITTI